MLLLAVALGCAPKVHPLQAQRDLLDELERAPLAPGWPAQASLGVGPALVTRLLDRGEDELMAQIPAVLEVPVPLVGSISVQNEVRRPSLGLARGACPSCVRAEVRLTGVLDVDLSSRAGRGMPWTADAASTLRLQVVPVEGAQEVRITPLPNSLDVRLALEGLAPTFSRAITGVMEQAVRTELEEGILGQPLSLLRIPEESPVHLRDVRVDVLSTVRVDLAFAVLQKGVVAAVPAIGDGWALVVPQDTLLGLMHAAAVRQELMRGFAVEPTSLALEEGRFTLGMRVWRAGRSERWVDYRVGGTVGLGPAGRLRFRADDAEEVGRQGRWGFAAGVVRQRVLSTLEDASVAVPGERELLLGKERWLLVVDGADADDARIVLRGRLEGPVGAVTGAASVE